MDSLDYELKDLRDIVIGAAFGAESPREGVAAAGSDLEAARAGALPRGA